MPMPSIATAISRLTGTLALSYIRLTLVTEIIYFTIASRQMQTHRWESPRFWILRPRCPIVLYILIGTTLIFSRWSDFLPPDGLLLMDISLSSLVFTFTEPASHRPHYGDHSVTYLPPSFPRRELRCRFVLRLSDEHYRMVGIEIYHQPLFIDAFEAPERHATAYATAYAGHCL